MGRIVRLLVSAGVASLLWLPPAVGWQEEAALTNVDILSFAEAELSAEDIRATIESRSTEFDTSLEAFVLLSRSGVAAEVLEAMTRATALAGRGREGPETFRDPLRSGGTGPELVVIPAGSFGMGCVSGVGCLDDEQPVHQVTIPGALAVGRYEVTFGEWDACVSAGGCSHRPNDSWGRGRHPVMRVSWDDAQLYVRWLSQQTGATYRLLSESEWEYAARAGSSTAYSWGNQIGSGRANCDGCGSQWDDSQTVPVGSFSPNAFGLHDMHGNVWEWVQDCLNESYGGAPSNGSVWQSGDCSRRVFRGGSWDYDPRTLRSAGRNWDSSDSRYDYGFRVARTLTP